MLSSNRIGIIMPVKVLAIDDDIEMTELLRFILESDLFDITTTNSGLDGIKLIRKHRYDVVIVDLSMPIMDGFEVCKEIRKFSNIPILILSAIKKPEIIVQALDEGADDYLVKPITKDVLAAHLNKIVRRAGNGSYELQKNFV